MYFIKLYESNITIKIKKIDVILNISIINNESIKFVDTKFKFFKTNRSSFNKKVNLV